MQEPDRLPLPSILDDRQQAAVAAISAGPRGGLFGPFVPLLRSPELMTRLQRVGEFLRFESDLAAHLRELAILLVARWWDQDFEWGHHAPLARSAGLPESVIEAVANAGDPVGSADVQAIWRLVAELLQTRRVTDDTYDAARELLGEGGVVELVALTGYYSTLAMTMVTARTPVPADYERLPEPRRPR
ncbi:carboxymuconolactone decarboxylase family protein [Mycolicibacterium sp. S2-37]|uniref:carboxymuconolactone decarboxylase family protein n=1 Tax=Mycolicibacterium sp. S2-37 TaxID=2810297 RepID=UPI001A949A73|nr:carboxymuconolactone decarboxylase family protein [Mycolicibacterium sp. S2-37]MBO0678645.1 carboxymuconolactone decarboxylase family protein [Mycolicibacterium sp. S2-37]